MILLRIFSSICLAALLLWTAKNKIQNPKASLPGSVPFVAIYKAALAKYAQNVDAATSEPHEHPADTSRKGHFTHDPTGQSLDPANGLENSGSNPLARGAYHKTGTHAKYESPGYKLDGGE